MPAGRGVPEAGPVLVALHGFTQGGWMWDELAERLGRRVVAPHLPGHGAQEGMVPDWSGAVRDVGEACAAAGDAATLIGYSMGGRIGLAAALDRPGVVRRLVLLSASAGIADPMERAARRAADEARARRLEEIGTAAFLDEWLALPMFAELRRRGAAWMTAEFRRRGENHAAGLAAALRNLGPGSQPFLGGRLGELAMPALFVAGERDERYVAAAAAMAEAVPDGEVAVVAGAGHAVVGEAPEVVAGLIDRFVRPA